MNGKGSNRRKGDDAVKYRENYDRIFCKNTIKEISDRYSIVLRKDSIIEEIDSYTYKGE